MMLPQFWGSALGAARSFAEPWNRISRIIRARVVDVANGCDATVLRADSLEPLFCRRGEKLLCERAFQLGLARLGGILIGDQFRAIECVAEVFPELRLERTDRNVRSAGCSVDVIAGVTAAQHFATALGDVSLGQ